jgi:hypothetical protein
MEEEDCAVWADSGAALPEIIELYVRLRHEQDSVESYWDGVAFLVVYGHEGDRGTHTLQLPIRKASFDPAQLSRVTSSQAPPSPLFSRMRLRPEAYLTVQVKVVPGRPTPPTPVASSILVAGPPSPRRLLSQEAMIAELEPVLKTLRQNERWAEQMRRRRAMDVRVPTMMYAGAGLPPPDDDNDNNSFCTVPFLGEWTSFMNRVVGLVNHCDPSTEQKPNQENVDVDECSTIATRDTDREIFGIQW